MRPPASRNPGRAGQSLVEFAMAATIFFTLLFGGMNVAYGVYCYHTISYAARDAVRWAIVRGPTSPYPATSAQVAQVAIRSAVGVQLTTSNVTVTWPDDASVALQKDAKVTISYPYRLMLSPGTVNLVSTSQMLVSQ